LIGIDLDNCYFNDATGNIATNGSVDDTRRKVIQYVPHANTVDSTRGHGTHVAGSVAGKREGADGIADGMAPAAKIAFFDVGFSGSAGLKIPNNPSALFEPGQAANAKIHSASWGTRDNAYGSGEMAYDSFMDLNDDFLFIVAAGNEGGRGGNSVGSPSICKNGISGKTACISFFRPASGY
jgi:subtilisin family serine protease